MIRTIIGLVQTARPLNALIAFLTIVAAGFIAGGTIDSFFELMLGGIVGILLTASGNIFNDVIDVEIDRINKPNRPLVTGRVTETHALRASILSGAAGISISAFLGIPAFIIAVLTTILLFLYNLRLKRVPLMGNFTIGVLTGAAFIFGGVIVQNPIAGIIPALFACLFNFAREILKDIEDIEGDKRGNVDTFPLKYGIAPSLVIATALFGVIIISSALPYAYDLYNSTYMIIVLVGVDFILLLVSIIMWISPKRLIISRLCAILKFDMIVGIMAIYFGA